MVSREVHRIRFATFFCERKMRWHAMLCNLERGKSSLDLEKLRATLPRSCNIFCVMRCVAAAFMQVKIYPARKVSRITFVQLHLQQYFAELPCRRKLSCLSRPLNTLRDSQSDVRLARRPKGKVRQVHTQLPATELKQSRWEVKHIFFGKATEV